MRIDLGSKGVGGRNEEWYAVEIDDDGNAFYIFEWNYLPFSGPIDKGVKRLPLDQAAAEPYYQAAIAAARGERPGG